MSLRNIKDLSPDEITQFAVGIGEPSFRSHQLGKWIYQKGVESFDTMTDLSRSFRQHLNESFEITNSVTIHDKMVSSDGTVKYLFTLGDGNQVESVLIPDKERYTLCISSQVGCALGCEFCLTSKVGKIRNLTPGEIVDQYIAVKKDRDLGVVNIVFMGMGEPLDNIQNLIAAIKIMTHKHYLAIAPRRITVSTSGLVPRIAELGKEVSVNLAVSLNAPNDSVRSEIMPINKRYPIKQLVAESRKFPLPNRKELMFEYVMLKGVNDSNENAHELGKLVGGFRCKVNLIPFNEAPTLNFKSPSRQRVLEFQEILMSYGINVRIRKSKGQDILGACGQLAANYPVSKTRTSNVPLHSSL